MSHSLKHPFELDLSDLEVLEPVDAVEQEDLNGSSGKFGGAFTKALYEQGGPIFTTLALGEEGGSPEPPTPIDPWRPIKPRPPICGPVPIKPPIATTQALGEEGGGYFPPIAYF